MSEDIVGHEELSEEYEGKKSRKFEEVSEEQGNIEKVETEETGEATTIRVMISNQE